MLLKTNLVGPIFFLSKSILSPRGCYINWKINDVLGIMQTSSVITLNINLTVVPYE